MSNKEWKKRSKRKLKIKKDFGLRCLVDKSTGEIVIFDETYPSSGIYHGHVRKWDDLNQEMKNKLITEGLFKSNGKKR